MTPVSERQRHWNALYASRHSDSVSWYQSTPSTSLELIEAVGAGPAT
jgi:hypothetical protein